MFLKSRLAPLFTQMGVETFGLMPDPGDDIQRRSGLSHCLGPELTFVRVSDSAPYREDLTMTLCPVWVSSTRSSQLFPEASTRSGDRNTHFISNALSQGAVDASAWSRLGDGRECRCLACTGKSIDLEHLRSLKKIYSVRLLISLIVTLSVLGRTT